MKLLQRLAGQTVVYGLTSILGRFLNYLLVFVHTRVLSTSKYGVVSVLYAWVSVVYVFFTYGMETAFFRFFNKEGEQKDRVYSTVLVSMLVSTTALSVVLITFARPIAVLLRVPNHPEYVVWFVLIMAFDAISAIPFSRLRQEHKAFRFAAVKLTSIAINIAGNLFFLWYCPWELRHAHAPFLVAIVKKIYNPEIGMGYIYIANLAASIATLLLLGKYLLPQLKHVDTALWKRMLRYGLPLIPVGLAGMINEAGDRIFLNYLLPGDAAWRTAQVGIYSACYKLSLIMTLFIQAVRMAAEPFFFEHAREHDARQTYALLMRYFVIACVTIFLTIMLYLDIFKCFIDRRFHGGLHIVPVLLMANLCLGVYYNLSIWYKLTDRNLFGAYISFGGAVLTIVLNIWWIPLLGYTGSAWATFACYAAMMIAGYSLGQKYYPVPYSLSHFFFCIFLGLGFYGVGFGLHHLVSGAIAQFALHCLLLAAFIGVMAWREWPRRSTPADRYI